MTRRSWITRRTALRGAAGIGAAGLLGCTPAPPDHGADPPPAPRPATTPAADPTPTTSMPTPTPSPSPRSTTAPPTDGLLTRAGPDLVRGPAASRGVALTFHGAGPVGLTREVLHVLSAAHARVTVFAVGQWLDAHPEVGAELVAAGHALGNHTWSHQVMTRLGAREARREVRRGAAAVAAVLGHPGPLFRPSGTPRSTSLIRAAARSAGYARCISYDVDSLDYLDPGPAAVRSRVLDQVRAGSVVSLHLGHRGTLEALPGLLSGLHDRGLTPVTVTQLFGGH